MSYQVRLSHRSTPFDAVEVEQLPSGWLRAIGSWPRWDLDEGSDEIIMRHGPRREYQWPPHRIKEVVRSD
jgi:hypothetical protein